MRLVFASMPVAVVLVACAGDPSADFDLVATDVQTDAIRYGEETLGFPAVGLVEGVVGGMSYLCSGTLIGADVVLTAAHCVIGAAPETTFFRVGADRTFGSGPTYGTSSIAVTPGFSTVGDASTPDLAVLRLHGTVANIAPLALASTRPPPSTPLVGVGFGQDETNGASGWKRSGSMVLASTTEGYAVAPGGGHYTPSILNVTPGPGDQISCPGDSGGPLLDRNGSIVGVASFSILPDGTPRGAYCTATYQAGYVSVADSAPLIASLTGSLPPAPLLPGACRIDDAAFSSEAGGCRDNQSGLVFSRRLAKARQDKAVARCRNLVESEYSDWRLPTANELRAMAHNGGASHLADGSDVKLWSKSRNGEDGIVVEMSTGAKKTSPRDKKRFVYCVRDG